MAESLVPFKCSRCKRILGLTSKTELVLGSFQSICVACGNPTQPQPYTMHKRLSVFKCVSCGQTCRWEPDCSGG